MQDKRNENYATFYNYYVAKEKAKKPRNFLRVFLISFLCFLLIFTIIFFRYRKTKNSEKFNNFAYLLMVCESNYASDAKDAADNVQKAGGAGYVWVDEKFGVVAFAYPSLAKAQAVEQNLAGTQWKTTIKKVDLKKPKTSKLTASQKAAINFFWDNVNYLYNLAVDFDKKSISETVVHKSLAKVLGDLHLIESKLLENNVDLILKSKLELASKIIDEFLKSYKKSNLFSSELKFICVQFVAICCDLDADIE